MLHSALNWKTIWIDGVFTDLTVSGNDSAHEQLWIDQTGARFRFLRGPVNGAAQTLIVSDGSSKLSMDIASGATQVSPMPQGIAGQFVPPANSSVAYLPNPLGEQISARASEPGLFIQPGQQSHGRNKVGWHGNGRRAPDADR